MIAVFQDLQAESFKLKRMLQAKRDKEHDESSASSGPPDNTEESQPEQKRFKQEPIEEEKSKKAQGEEGEMDVLSTDYVSKLRYAVYREAAEAASKSSSSTAAKARSQLTDSSGSISTGSSGESVLSSLNQYRDVQGYPYDQDDNSVNTAQGTEEEDGRKLRKERNKMHAKLSRDRSKLFAVKLSEAIATLEKVNADVYEELKVASKFKYLSDIQKEQQTTDTSCTNIWLSCTEPDELDCI